jgi:hypothetical protein
MSFEQWLEVLGRLRMRGIMLSEGTNWGGLHSVRSLSIHLIPY